MAAPRPLGRGPVPVQAHGRRRPVAAGSLAGVALDAAAGTSGLFKSAAELFDSIIGKQVDLGLVRVNAGVAGGGHRVATALAQAAENRVGELKSRGRGAHVHL